MDATVDVSHTDGRVLAERRAAAGARADQRLRPRQRAGRRRGAARSSPPTSAARVGADARAPTAARAPRATPTLARSSAPVADPLMATASLAAPAAGAGTRAPAAATPQTAPLQGAELVLGTIALSLATFMNVLDSSIANVSIPAISGDLGVSPSQGTWVITSFAVANAISVPLTGWLTQRFGPVRLFVASILLFVIASWLCGLAPNIGMLIAFRVLQGFVAGPMIPLSQTLLLSSYPRAKAGTAMAMWAMTVLVAPVAGSAARRLDHRQHLVAVDLLHQHPGRPDRGGGHLVDLPQARPGLAQGCRSTTSAWRCSCSGSARMQIMIDKGKELDWFGSTQIVVLAVVAVVGFAFFLAWELTEEHPIVDLRLFARRNFLDGNARRSSVAYGSSSATSSCCRSGCSSTWATPRPGPGWRPRRSASWRSSSRRGSARTSRKIDPRKLATVAFLGFGVRAAGMRSHFNAQADFDTILIPTVLQGAAMAFFFIPLQAIIFSGLTPEPHAGRGGPAATSRASPPARSAPRSSRPCGRTAPRCTTRSSPRGINNAQQRGRRRR